MSLFSGQGPRGVFPSVTVTGFTTVLPVQPVQAPSGNGSGSRQIYVSSSTGNDSTGNGTIGNPYATAAKGATFIRTSGFSDQLLFKCGDTFTADTVANTTTGLFAQHGVAPTILSGDYITGATVSGPILIGSYGVGARPIFRFPIGLGPNSRQGSFMSCQNLTDGNNVAIIGLSFYAYTRDPANGSYVGAATAAADGNTNAIWYAITAGTWSAMTVVIEDCIFNYFCISALSFQGADVGAQAVSNPITLVIRRNIVMNSYSGSGGHSQGMFTHGIQNIYFIENFWDHCGWSEDAGLIAQSPGTGATAFNRNIYDGNSGVSVQGATIRISHGEIHARGSSNTQWRCGCDVSDGLFLANLVGGFDLGENFGTSANTDSHVSQVCTAQRNTILQSSGISSSNASAAVPGGAGIFLNNISNAVLNNNIVANCDTSSSNSISIEWGSTGGNNTVSGNVVTNLITFKINTAYTSAAQSSEVDVSSGTNFVDLTGSNGGSSPEPFPHPTPTNSSLVGDYYQSIGGTGNYVDFLTACSQRAAGTWNRAFSAYGVNNYIQGAFNVGYRS